MISRFMTGIFGKDEYAIKALAVLTGFRFTYFRYKAEFLMRMYGYPAVKITAVFR